MNATGTPLSNTDKIRNYLLMGFDEDKRYDLYSFWEEIENNLSSSSPDLTRKNLENFIFDYVRMKKETRIEKEDIYTSFKSFVENKNEKNKDEINKAKENMLHDLRKFSKYYKDYIGGIQPNIKCDDYRYLLYELRIMKHTTPYPFLLRIEDELQGERNWEPIFANIIDLITIYIVRRALSNVSTSSLSNFFLTLHKNIFTNNKDIEKTKFYEIVYCYFEKIIGKDAMPDDKKIIDNSTLVDLYKNKVLLPVLSSVENGRFKYNKANEKERIFGNCSNQNDPSIEHIMPQDIENSNEWKRMLSTSLDNKKHFDPYEVHKRLLNTIGNLTILTTKFNSSSSNNSFFKKVQIIKKGFEDGKIEYKTLNDYAYKYTIFNSETIEKRGKELINNILTWYPFKKGKFKNDYKFGSVHVEVIKKIKEINPKYFCNSELIEYKFLEDTKPCKSFKDLINSVFLELYVKDKNEFLDIIKNRENELEKNSITFKTSTSIVDKPYVHLIDDLYVKNTVNTDYQITYLLTFIKAFGLDSNNLELSLKNSKEDYTCYKLTPLNRLKFIKDNILEPLSREGKIHFFDYINISNNNLYLYFSSDKINSLLEESKLIDNLGIDYVYSGTKIKSPIVFIIRFYNLSKSANVLSLLMYKQKNNEKLYNKLNGENEKEKLYFFDEFIDWNIGDNVNKLQDSFMKRVDLIEKLFEAKIK